MAKWKEVGGANKSMTLRPRVSQLERLSLFFALNKTKAAPCVDQDGR